ncbi:uncharacterized protein [Arachis hypogaea]|uniref:uncharacterized protein n=1 Tax=Arachis hypogaea TaxID=3818 RepID=UPI003B21C416
MVSVEWLEEFPETWLRGEPRDLSDHYPIIVEDKRMRGDPRPFQSLESWFTHESFLRMVKEEWRGLGELQFTEKLKTLTGPLGRWHKDNFGEMDKKILKFEEEIKKVDDMVSNGVYDGTMEARRKALVTCCERWYVRKEIHWKQMSRSRQAKEMDRNTRYFHNIALARRRNNWIDALIVNGRLRWSGGKIDEEESVTLEVMPSAEEIRKEVWDCESSKALGCDGYNMNFIKRCWDEIGAEFTTAVIGFFQTSRLLADSNITWVALALQSAFVKGRKIHDGTLIACETVHWLKRRNKEAAIIKLDFQKAYDRVKWSFMDIVLQKMGFGHRWRVWVMECVTTTSMLVLINGSPSKPFKMERGLRQGDPLSPFLFVLVVDVLHRMVGEAVRIGRISPLVVGRDSVELLHLQFADDTILFCPPENQTMKNYKRLLRWCYKKECYQRTLPAIASRRRYGKGWFHQGYGGAICLMWSAWISVFGRHWPFLGLVKDHFLSWTDEPRRKEDRKQRLRCFCAIIWHIWMERNRMIFQNKSKGVENIINMTMLSCDEWRGVHS